jgi:hypothetical protein
VQKCVGNIIIVGLGGEFLIVAWQKQNGLFYKPLDDRYFSFYSYDERSDISVVQVFVKILLIIFLFLRMFLMKSLRTCKMNMCDDTTGAFSTTGLDNLDLNQ